MRKFVLAAAMAGTALTLAACSETAEEADTPTEEAAADTEAAAEETAGVLDANTATAEDLAGVEGVTPELAEAIVAGQPYADVTGLNAVLLANVSEEEAAAVLVNVFVPINLNDASAEAIGLIPGMTDRMVHEFEEYRPYEDMAEFDREIGKYVDEEEVARLRTYVTL
ncbi:helix-hairpin-helix domain-containing protein [Aurantiacibacter sp. MUD11]|uniref:helix-hairpin-helix domain-containing protein n=1 Tax=Aurantiacibacter sp. MUD11 TaxID=3003265 RepID=UPI0022AAC3C4|nr:helix-hairpin-helix domain-containing protein [Aurantiacibacter sp. MUD11]WAT16759.1 helix-hairpin-helix domain-containing protein [Aurantiacibacter sp. MUD11]